MRHKSSSHNEMLTRTEKWCPACESYQSVLNFTTSKARPDGRANWCRPCAARKGREYRANWTEARRVRDTKVQRQRRQARYERDPDGVAMAQRRYHLKWAYGLTDKGLREMLQAQQGKCAICRRALGLKWDIDHSHKSTKVRGLLCRSCNIILGHAQDNPEVLRAAISYLEVHDN